MNFEIALLLIQGLFAVVMLFASFTLKAMRDDIKDNSRSVASLAQKIAEKEADALDKFVPKDEWQAMRERVHDLSNSVTVLNTRARIFDRSASDPRAAGD